MKAQTLHRACISAGSAVPVLLSIVFRPSVIPFEQSYSWMYGKLPLSGLFSDLSSLWHL